MDSVHAIRCFMFFSFYTIFNIFINSFFTAAINNFNESTNDREKTRHMQHKCVNVHKSDWERVEGSMYVCVRMLRNSAEMSCRRIGKNLVLVLAASFVGVALHVC